jgi:hypothetical protein
MSQRCAGVLLLALAALVPGGALAHEERLVVGRVETIDAGRKLLVVVNARGGQRQRLEVNPETEVIACRTAAGLAALHAGAMVRVRYLDRAGAGAEVQSILLLGGGR